MPKIPWLPEEPITALRHLFLQHQPSSHAQMTEAGYTAKYLRVPKPIADTDLAAHLAGDVTLACLLQRDDSAYVAACDIDSGGEAMVRRVMRAAEIRACHAYGFVLESGNHDGGHVWIFFDQAHLSHDLQVLMRDIVADAQCPTTEIYPNGADLRLPFGVHRRCNRRGTLLLNSAAAPLDLDSDIAGTLATFLANVRLTSGLPVRVAIDTQQARRAAVAESIAVSRPRRVDPDAHWREVIAQFNESTNLVSLLEGYGARAVYHYPGGKTLLHCAASQDHAHGDKHPSLIVEPGRGHQTGKMICGCYCPACRLHNRPGQVMDAFEVFCRLENITKREGVQRIQSTGGSRQAAAPNAQPSVTCHLPPATLSTCSGQACHLPPDTHAAQRRLVDIHTDRRAQPLDRRLLAYVIAHDVQGQGLANATIAAALGARPDSIKRAKRRLRELGYIDVIISVDGVSPSAITIISAQSVTSVAASEVDSSPSIGAMFQAGGGVQEAPPFHVTKNTCDGPTPPPESKPTSSDPSPPEALPAPERTSLQEEMASSIPVTGKMITKLRRRQSVLLGMLRAGVPERRRLAFTAELRAIEQQLEYQSVLPKAQLPTSAEALRNEERNEVRPFSAAIPLARPEDPHPTLTNTQLTALLHDALSERLDPKLQPLVEQVCWELRDDEVALICRAHDLALVTGGILGLAQWVLDDLKLTGVRSVMRVHIGQPIRGDIWPTWLDEELWQLVPVMLRPLLVGSTLVEGRIYGASRDHTAALAAYSTVIAWLLDQRFSVDDAVLQTRGSGSALTQQHLLQTLTRPQ